MNSHLEELRHVLEAAVEGLSSDQLTRRPPGKWCAAEVLEHLYLTYTGTIKGFEKVRAAGKPLAGRGTMALSWRRLVVLGLGYFPRGRKSPLQVEPRGLPVEQVRNEIGAKIAAMDAILSECEARDGARTRLLDHPILGPLTASQWRKFHLLHGRHHAKQIARLRAAGTSAG
jgi:hypothetical protein